MKKLTLFLARKSRQEFVGDGVVKRVEGRFLISDFDTEIGRSTECTEIFSLKGLRCISPKGAFYGRIGNERGNKSPEGA
jgi:hypothetical protein